MQNFKEKYSTKRLRTAVMFGGRSVEHEISVITALQLIEALDQHLFEVIPVYITPKGKWITGEVLLSKELYKHPAKLEQQCREVTLLPKPGVGGLTVLSQCSDVLGTSTSELNAGVIPIDVVLLAFHGEYGEDGCMQGVCEMADIAYTGSPLGAAAAAMDKYLCKLIVQSLGISVLPALRVTRHEAQNESSTLLARIHEHPALKKYPLFVKPCNLGSSVGISKVDSPDLLLPAIAKALRHDTTALIEPCVSSLMEINVSVRALVDGTIQASVVEVPVSASGVLSYEEKYLRDGGKKSGGSRGMASLTRVIDPADLSVEIKQKVVSDAQLIYRTLGCNGVARLDFIMDLVQGTVYFNELNAFPGSVAFYLWIKSSPPVLFTDLLSEILYAALERKALKDALDHNIGLKALSS